MCAIQVVVSVVGGMTDATFIALGSLFLLFIIILTYLVGSCKVRNWVGCE